METENLEKELEPILSKHAQVMEALGSYLEQLENADTDQQQIIDKTKRMRKHFLEDGTIDKDVRPEIAASWQRCRKAGLSKKYSVPDALDGEELKVLLEQYAYFINTAGPVIDDSLSKALNTELLPLAMYITDPKGNVLYVSSTNQFAAVTMSQLGMRVGAKWNEEMTGTNSVTLALRYQRNFTTTAYEHYVSGHALFNCISAIIHDNDGIIIGTMTLTYYRGYYNPMLTSFVYTTARLVEEKMQMQRARGVLSYVMNNSDHAILVLDSAGTIVQANMKFYQTIGTIDVDLVNLNVNLLLRDFDWKKSFEDKKMHASIGETFLNYQTVCRRVRVDGYLVNLYGRKDGYVIVLQDIDDIISLSQKYTGNANIFRFENIITGDPEMKRLIEESRQIANQNCSVLIEGESGTGKELFSESIHSCSSRRKGPFVAVNCAALPLSLVESELFGYEKGTFTDGLTTGKAGKFEQADGGTIFLDEVGDLSLDIQAKLLRVLDNNRITRIGGATEKKLDIRVISATNRNLYEMVLERSFREDLYYRLCTFSITLPPLNDREGDIPLLTNYFLKQLCMNNRGLEKRMADESMELLENYHWNGNVRELQNAVSRAYHLCNEAVIGPVFLPNKIRERARPERRTGLPNSTRNHERDMIIRTLDANAWNISKAAQQLGISRATIYRKMKALNINHEE